MPHGGISLYKGNLNNGLNEQSASEVQNDGSATTSDALQPEPNADNVSTSNGNVSVVSNGKSTNNSDTDQINDEKSPAEAEYESAINTFGDKVSRKIKATFDDRAADLEKKKALDKAQNNFDDAPIGKDEKAKKALEKAQKGWGEKGGLLPDTKQQKVEGSTKEVSVEQRMLTEALVEHLNRIGVEASADIDEGQRMKLHWNLKSLTQRGTIYEFLVEVHSSCI